jgi:signal transduction histidine kinase
MQGTEQQTDERLRNELADAIERHTQEIVSGWLDQVRRDAAAAHVPLTDLQDGIADYLKRLAALLRGRASIARVASSAWHDVASEHALTRIRLGFDVTQLVREIVALRRVTAHILREEGLLTTGGIELLIALVDEAMAASIQSYVDWRDYDARRVEAEHIGFITHELKNPIAVVAMASEQLCAQVSTPEQRRLCAMVERNISRIREMLEEVLAAERLQSGDTEIHATVFKVEELLRDALAPFKRRAEQKGVELVLEYDPATELVADRKLTLSATENLLDNAIKYTDHGTVRLQIEDEPAEVVFHVRDECGGLSEEQLAMIFEPFKRAHSSKPGTGLGLSITRQAIEAQGGTIQAESTGGGCHFWFSLPKRQH